jgi:L-amino acid N-acyltransferase YncA
MKSYTILSVTPANVADAGIYCIKDKKSDGAKAKAEWFGKQCNDGLRLKIIVDKNGKQAGFIEYVPSEDAWRPVAAENYFFIHCIALFVKEARHKALGTSLLQACEQDATMNKKSGVCALTSAGAWMASKTLFERNGYAQVDALDRFELMAKRFNDKSPTPRLVNWKKQQSKYKGWNLVYANQCPWHKKSVETLKQVAADYSVNLNVWELATPKEAQKAPSGFGVYSLIRDGRLLEDHYLSATRFESILKEELKDSIV